MRNENEKVSRFFYLCNLRPTQFEILVNELIIRRLKMKKIFKLGTAACLAVAFVFAGCKNDDDESIYSVTLSANNTEWGTVAGGGEYADGTEISIMATANSGYHFEKWSDDDTNNPRTITVSKNIALIAIFAEGNGGSSVNGGGNNNSGNTGATTGDILPKKVTKIVYKYSKNSELRRTTTYLFDANGKVTSTTDEKDGDIGIENYSYNDSTILCTKNHSSCVYNIENGRIVSDILDDGGTGKYIYPSTYAYTSDGYIASKVTTSKKDGDIVEKSDFAVTDGNITTYYRYSEGFESRTAITFGDKPNNLNVDIALYIVDYDLWVTGYFGKRSKNLPSSYNLVAKPQNAADDGERYVGEFTYTYDGDYLTKVFCLEKCSDSKTYEYTWEIFYE